MKLIRDIRIGEWFGVKKRLMVNGIPMFGQNPPDFAGLEDAAFLDWFSKQMMVLVSEVRGGSTLSVKDVVLSYQSFLASETSFFGGGDLYYAGSIPLTYVEHARDAYVRTQSADEEILFLYNDGGNGEGGVVLTDRNLFSHASGHDFYFMWPLTDIRSVWIGYTRARRMTYLYVIVNEQRVFGWPHTFQSQSPWLSWITRPAFSLAALICQVVSVVGGSQLSMPTTIIDLTESGVNFRISEGQNY